jgi:hypothetical protein
MGHDESSNAESQTPKSLEYSTSVPVAFNAPKTALNPVRQWPLPENTILDSEPDSQIDVCSSQLEHKLDHATKLDLRDRIQEH